MWRRCIGCLNLQISFRKRAIHDRALMWKMCTCTYMTESFVCQLATWVERWRSCIHMTQSYVYIHYPVICVHMCIHDSILCVPTRHMGRTLMLLYIYDSYDSVIYITQQYMCTCIYMTQFYVCQLATWVERWRSCIYMTQSYTFLSNMCAPIYTWLNFMCANSPHGSDAGAPVHIRPSHMCVQGGADASDALCHFPHKSPIMSGSFAERDM